MRASVAVFLLLLAVLAGCGDKAPPATPKENALPATAVAGNGVILGVVVDAAVAPIKGATVALDDPPQNATTDAQGRFSFSNVPAGTHFVTATHPLFLPIQAAVDVEADVLEPDVIKVQLAPKFNQKPFAFTITQDGFFTCSQDGASVFYSSSNCSDGIFGPVSKQFPELSNLTTQTREWEADVGPGWQSIVFEMQWEPTSQTTSNYLGMIVSTQKSTRDGTHCFAEGIQQTPFRIQIDVDQPGPDNCGVEPNLIPPEGMQHMSYFVSVRGDPDSFAPGLAINQKFQVFVSFFHYGFPPEGWSFINGDPAPF